MNLINKIHMSKLITFLAAPASGKSTLATSVHTELKKSGKNSIFIPEVATDFIAEFGIPNEPIDQLVIFYKQRYCYYKPYAKRNFKIFKSMVLYFLSTSNVRKY